MYIYIYMIHTRLHTTHTCTKAGKTQTYANKRAEFTILLAAAAAVASFCDRDGRHLLQCDAQV